jgi:23S rRNA (cytosine1962-C5)-methyltransferase
MAMDKIKAGGLIFSFSCSQVVDRRMFNATLQSAAIQSGRKIRILHELSQAACHPLNAFHPEGHYLKGLVLYVE